MDCSLLALQSVIQKIRFNEKFFTIAKMIGNWLLSLLTSFTILGWKNNVRQKQDLVLNATWNAVHFRSDKTLLNFWKSLDYKWREKRVAFDREKFPWKFENPVSQRRSDQIVLKYFGRKFVTYSRTEAATEIWGFVSTLDIRGPSSCQQNLRKKIVKKKNLFGLHQNVNRKILNQKLGEVKAQWGLIFDAQREVLSNRCIFVLHVWASCGLAVPRVVLI